MADDVQAIPRFSFENKLELEVGKDYIINHFLGEGHTKDNMIGYIPSEKMLFGGCMIKEMGASKGNISDANLDEWSNTVSRIKKVYPKIKHVIPGHGKPGGTELLDYTIELFQP